MAQGRNLRSRAEVRNEIPGPAWSNKDRKSRTPDRAGAEGFGKRRNSLQRRVGVRGCQGATNIRKSVGEEVAVSSNGSQGQLFLRSCGRRAEKQMGAGKGCGATRSIGYFEGRGRVSHVVLGWCRPGCP